MAAGAGLVQSQEQERLPSLSRGGGQGPTQVLQAQHQGVGREVKQPGHAPGPMWSDGGSQYAMVWLPPAASIF